MFVDVRCVKKHDIPPHLAPFSRILGCDPDSHHTSFLILIPIILLDEIHFLTADRHLGLAESI
jgi:hypothetical protein